mmetsp:Transcript_12171/g.14309  ORF Transcript_12171/g.14309 Transcript_12171/m.14309 type:complete len:106 (-) Transcript_12171:442-759(-)
MKTQTIRLNRVNTLRSERDVSIVRTTSIVELGTRADAADIQSTLRTKIFLSYSDAMAYYHRHIPKERKRSLRSCGDHGLKVVVIGEGDDTQYCFHQYTHTPSTYR